MFTDRFIQSKAIVFSSHIMFPLLKGGQNKTSLSYHFSNSSEQLWSIHPSLRSTSDMQPGFLFQKIYIEIGDFPLFFKKKAKFRLGKNEKKKKKTQKNLLIFNVAKEGKKIKSLNSKNNVFCCKKLLPWNLWPQSNDIHKWSHFFNPPM